MSVQCPHCGGEFQVELTLSVPAVEVPIAPKAVQPVTASKRGPAFATHTDAGKMRQAFYVLGNERAAEGAHIYNDKRDFGRRLKFWHWLPDMTQEQQMAVEAAIVAQFGDRIIKIKVSHGEILVYLNS